MKQRININLIPSGVVQVIHLSQNDYLNGELEFHVYHGSSVVGEKIINALIKGIKTDNNVFIYNAAQISGNVVTFDVKEQMTAAGGKAVCKLRIQTASGAKHSKTFILDCEADPTTGGTASESDIEALEELIESIEGDIVDAKTAADEAADYAEQAKSTVVDVRRDITNIQQDVSSIQNDVAETKNDVSGLQTSLNGEISNRTTQDAVLSARMDEFTKLPDGSLSTAADAELADIRVMVGGKTASTAGDAVRTQITDQKNALWQNIRALDDGKRIFDFVWGNISPNGSIDYNYTSRVVNSNYEKFDKETTLSLATGYGLILALYDDSYALISRALYSGGNVITVPANTYFRVCVYHGTIVPSTIVDLADKVTYPSDIPEMVKQDAYAWRGWKNHDSDANFERIIVKLKKDANLVFTGADTNNQYLDYLMFVDAEGNYLTEGKRRQTGNTEDTVLAADFPADAVYAVITYKRGQLKASTITNGSIVQFAPPNTFELLNKGGAEIVIPSEITAVVGDTLQIYYDSIVKSTEPVKVEFVGTKGKAFERYFEYTPTSNDVGNSTIVINARKYDNLASSYSTIVATKTITIKTISVPTSPSTEKHVLCVGDSTIVGGAYVKEIARRICGTGGTPVGNNLSNIKFTGRLNKTVDDIVVGYEGFSGWSWNSYISSAIKAIRFYVSGVTSLNFEAVYQDANGCKYNIAEINVTDGSGNIRCLYVMGSASTTPPTSGTLTRISGSGDTTIAYTSIEVEQFAPFVDDGQVTFTPYVDEYCSGSVDYVLFSLGTNVIVNSNAEFSTIKANMLSQMDTLIGKLHEQYPTAVVLLCTLQKGSMNGGFGANFGTAYNASSEFYNHKVYELNQAYIEFASTRSYVKLVDVSGEFDTIYDFPHTMKNVNVRDSTEKEMIDTNFGHPSNIGYMQMADAMYRALCGELVN